MAVKPYFNDNPTFSVIFFNVFSMDYRLSSNPIKKTPKILIERAFTSMFWGTQKQVRFFLMFSTTLECFPS